MAYLQFLTFLNIKCGISLVSVQLNAIYEKEFIHFQFQLLTVQRGPRHKAILPKQATAWKCWNNINCIYTATEQRNCSKNTIDRNDKTLH